MRDFEDVLKTAGVPLRYNPENAASFLFDKVDGKYCLSLVLIAVIKEELAKRKELISEYEKLMDDKSSIGQIEVRVEELFTQEKVQLLEENDLITAAYKTLNGAFSSSYGWMNLSRSGMLKDVNLLGPFNHVKREMLNTLQNTIKAVVGLRFFLREFNELDGLEVSLSIYKNKINSQIKHLAPNSYDWSNRTVKVQMDQPVTSLGWVQNESEAAENKGGTMEFNFGAKDLEGLYAAGIDMSSFRVNSKKGVIGAVEKVDPSELAKSLKNISTVVGDQTIAVYKITKGIRIVNLRSCSEYWGSRRKTLSELNEWVSTLEGYYYVRIEANGGKYVSVASSLGRALSSSAKSLQNAILDSFDLDLV